MVTPAMQLAGKISDVHVQLWASSLLKGKVLFYGIWFASFTGNHMVPEPQFTFFIQKPQLKFKFWGICKVLFWKEWFITKEYLNVRTIINFQCQQCNGIWMSVCLVDLYGLCGDTANEQEGYRMHNTFTQSLLKDLLQSSQLPEHGLIHVSLNMDSYL